MEDRVPGGPRWIPAPAAPGEAVEAVGAWAVPAPGFSLQPCGAGGTQSLAVNVAVLRGERRGMDSLGGVSGDVTAPQ